jgi:cell division protein FtsQ
LSFVNACRSVLAGGEDRGVAPERRSHAALEAAVQPFAARPSLSALARHLPSGRSLAVGFALLALAVGAYAGARSSSVFAIEVIQVQGLPPQDAAAARAALRSLERRSLVGIRRADLQQRLAPLPGVSAFEYDRAFPHTLVVRVVAEVPLAVLRRGDESWLVSRRGRVLRQVPRGTRLDLPRVWVPRRLAVVAGSTLAEDAGGSAVRALDLLQTAGVEVRARTVRMAGELTYVLRSGLEVRLGSPRGAELKLAVAAEILPRLDPDVGYLDVSVPSRPVAGTDSQVEG